jgi:hypothetical protein
MLPSGSQLNAPAVHPTHFLCSIVFQSFRPILALPMESNCQSSFQHGPRDLQSHYFGCLKNSEREAFLKRLPERNRVRIRDEEHRIARLRSIFKTREDIEEGVLFRRHTLSLRRWRATQVKANPQSYPSSTATATKNSTDGSDDGEGQSGSRRGSHRIPHLRTYIDEADDDVDIFANMIFFKDVSPFIKTCPYLNNFDRNWKARSLPMPESICIISLCSLGVCCQELLPILAQFALNKSH